MLTVRVKKDVKLAWQRVGTDQNGDAVYGKARPGDTIKMPESVTKCPDWGEVVEGGDAVKHDASRAPASDIEPVVKRRGRPPGAGPSRRKSIEVPA